MSHRAVIEVENLSKFYQLGLIGGGTLREDLGRWWARARGRPDPLLKIGEQDHGNREGEHLWALRDVSFQVREGEVLGVIGRNGAGKSTLLKILSRITAPTSGRAVIKGRVGSLLEVGTGFHPELTGRENIYLNGAILGMSRAEITRKLEEIVEFASMSKFIDTPVKRYSSGMAVRLAFSVAAHLETDVLIVDEVLAVGDQSFQKKCVERMGDLSGKGRTILIVSHQLPIITQLCERSVYFKNGQVCEIGLTRNVVSTYLSQTTDESIQLNRQWSGVGAEIVFADVCRASAKRKNIKLRMRFKSDRQIKGAIGGLVLYDRNGIPVWGSNGRFHEADGADRTLASGTLSLSATSLPITPGRYSISLWLADHYGDLDSIERALTIDLGDESTLSPRPAVETIGSLDWPARWSLEDHSEAFPLTTGTGDTTCSR